MNMKTTFLVDVKRSISDRKSRASSKCRPYDSIVLATKLRGRMSWHDQDIGVGDRVTESEFGLAGCSLNKVCSCHLLTIAQEPVSAVN